MFDAIVLGEYQSPRSCISISARQRIPLGSECRLGENALEFPWKPARQTERKTDGAQTKDYLPSSSKELSASVPSVT